MPRSHECGRRSRRGSKLIYTVLLLGGFLGLLAMALMGFMHGHGHGNGDHGHVHLGDVHAGHGAHVGHGHTHGGAGHAGHGHGAAGHSHGQHDNPNADGDAQGGLGTALLFLMPLLSPLNWFSWMVGAGAAGSLAASFGVQEPVRAGVAVVGALGFSAGIVKPLWRLAFAFVSEPARNLEGCVAQEVEAVTGFNERGEGLVRVTIDGHSDDVLARLVDGERGIVHVRRGDRLLIQDVDPHTNSCKVSKA